MTRLSTALRELGSWNGIDRKYWKLVRASGLVQQSKAENRALLLVEKEGSIFFLVLGELGR
jgi:hypothetical protein